MDNSVTGVCELQEQTLGRLAGVHVAMLHTGRVLFFSYYDPEENNLDLGLWQLWDPQTGPIAPDSLVMERNLFCSGHCLLPDGRLLVAGGQSYNFFPFVRNGADHDLHTFDPVNESWSRHEDMPGARWYPTCVTLPDGNALIAGGQAVRFRPFGANNDEYEIFNWRNDSKSPPSRFNPGHINDPYPFMNVLPDGSSSGVLFVHSGNEARLFYLQSRTWNSTRFRTNSRFSRTYDHQGSCVLLPLLSDAPERVRVLVIGGEGENGQATNTAEIFEFNRERHEDSHWRAPDGGNMEFRRFMSDAVLLPDGTVLVINGAGGGKADDSHDPVMNAELFDPTTETWRTLASLNHPRLYHSSAVLLPDARVIISGNTRHWNPGNETEDVTVEIFSPPYLFRGPRPSITNSPDAMYYGREYVISSPDAASIAKVAIIRTSSTTHTNNMDQRHVGLSIVRRDGNTLVVNGPENGAVAPPGYYILFLVNSNGIPSVGRFVHLATYPLQRFQHPVTTSPSQINLGEPVEVTVNVADAAEPHGPVAGTVRIINYDAGGRSTGLEFPTNTPSPAAITFRSRTRRVIDPITHQAEFVVDYPEGEVTAPDYASSGIQFRFIDPNEPRMLRVSVSPRRMPIGRQVQFTAHAVDDETGDTVVGTVTIGGQAVGNTDSPINFTFGAVGQPGIVSRGGYVDTAIPWELYVPEPPRPRVWVTPYPVTPNVSVQVTVNAQYADVDASISGIVRLRVPTTQGQHPTTVRWHNEDVGITNTPFNYSFRSVSTWELDDSFRPPRWMIRDTYYPTGSVVSLPSPYADTDIDFGLPV